MSQSKTVGFGGIWMEVKQRLLCGFVSGFVFYPFSLLRMSSLLVVLFKCLLDLTTSDLHPAITLATAVHLFHIWDPGTAYLRP